MTEKIKETLSQAWFWILALCAGIFFLWQKKTDLQDQLDEEKADARIKDDKQTVVQADERAADAVDNFNKLSKLYEKQHPND